MSEENVELYDELPYCFYFQFGECEEYGSCPYYGDCKIAYKSVFGEEGEKDPSRRTRKKRDLSR